MLRLRERRPARSIGHFTICAVALRQRRHNNLCIVLNSNATSHLGPWLSAGGESLAAPPLLLACTCTCAAAAAHGPCGTLLPAAACPDGALLPAASAAWPATDDTSFVPPLPSKEGPRRRAGAALGLQGRPELLA